MEKHYYGWDPKIAARKELNMAIFSETMDICKAGWYAAPFGKRVELPPKTDEESEFASKYKVVRFAVIEDHNSNNRNYKAFEAEFGRARTPAAPCDGMRIDGRARTPAAPQPKSNVDFVM